MNQLIISLLCFLFCIIFVSIPLWLIFVPIRCAILKYDIKNNRDTSLVPLNITFIACIAIASIVLYKFIW